MKKRTAKEKREEELMDLALALAALSTDKSKKAEEKVKKLIQAEKDKNPNLKGEDLLKEVEPLVISILELE